MRSADDLSPSLLAVLESAARLQQLVPDAVLVGGSVAALYTGHRDSEDHGRVLANLSDQFDAVLEAVKAKAAWVTNRLVPGKLILEQLGDIETGVRQMIRTVPLETAQVALPGGQNLTVPTDAEALRIKAWLIVRRNQTRDFLDVAALVDHMGIDLAAHVLSGIDRFYRDQRGEGDGVSSQLFRQLSDPRPKDSATIDQLATYKNLAARWHDWRAVVEVCHAVADRMLDPAP